MKLQGLDGHREARAITGQQQVVHQAGQGRPRIVDGQRFDENFARGLARSTVFSPLVSPSCLKSFVDLEQEDKEFLQELDDKVNKLKKVKL